MNYSKINRFDVANGEGVRVSLFVSGCPHRCKGCFNPKTWDYDYGKAYDNDTEGTILYYLSHSAVQGLTLLGGEPLAPRNREVVLELLKICRAYYPEKDIWCYTGYTFEEIKDYEGLNYIDVLVDGKYIEEERDVSLQFRGSRNQRIIDLNETRMSGKVELWNGSES